MKKTDLEIQQAVLCELKWDTRVEETDVGVEVDAGVVTLTGAVSSWAKRMAAQEAAHRVAGVLYVANDVHVVPGTSISFPAQQRPIWPGSVPRSVRRRRHAYSHSVPSRSMNAVREGSGRALKDALRAGYGVLEAAARIPRCVCSDDKRPVTRRVPACDACHGWATGRSPRSMGRTGRQVPSHARSSQDRPQATIDLTGRSTVACEPSPPRHAWWRPPHASAWPLRWPPLQQGARRTTYRWAKIAGFATVLTAAPRRRVARDLGTGSHRAALSPPRRSPNRAAMLLPMAGPRRRPWWLPRRARRRPAPGPRE